MEPIDMKKLKRTMKKKQLKESAVQTAQRASEWIRQNRDTLVNVRRDERAHHLGHYWQLKRPLKQSEQLLVNQRRKNGEPWAISLRA